MSTQQPELPKSGSVSFDTRARLYAWHTDNGLDPDTAQPYFQVTYQHPIEFLHDWPDFGDLTGRYWEGALMAADMTGVKAANTDRLRDNLLSWFAPNGLNYRPLTPYTTYAAELFDQSRTLLALCTAYMYTGDTKIADQMKAMTDGLFAVSEPIGEFRTIPGVRYGKDGWENASFWEDDTAASGYFVGPLARPLVKVWQLLGYEPALELARGFCGYAAEIAQIIKPDGEFDSHVHSRLAMACGLHVCGKATGEKRWMDVARNAWDFARSYAGPAGSVPEFLGEGTGRIRSETCALMDYLELTLLLALAGDETKWGEAEKILRNHLIESQAIRDDWGTDGKPRPKDELMWTDNVPHRQLGAFAGWSALDSYFGLAPTGSEKWVYGTAPKEIYLKKRLFQNCCAGSGMKALYLAWAQAVTCQDGKINVNLLVNRETSDASVAVREVPRAIEVSVTPKRFCSLSIRMPEWTDSEAVKITAKTAASITSGVQNGRMHVVAVSAGDRIVLCLPFSLRTERHPIRHENSEPEVFDLTFKGDSVVGVEAVSGRSTHEEKMELSPLYEAYPLYQRDPSDVYGDEPRPICSDASIDWT